MAGTIKFRKGNTTCSVNIFTDNGSIYTNYCPCKLISGVAHGTRGVVIFSETKSSKSPVARYPTTGDLYRKYYGDTSGPTLAVCKNGKMYYAVKSGVNLYFGYKLILNANGGTSSSGETQTSTGELAYSNYILAPAQSFIRAGYTFSKWNTSSNGSGTSYRPQQDTLDATSLYGGGKGLTLYAIWDITTYSIVYKANGGNGSDVTQSFNYGTSVTTKGAIFTRANYNMTKWNTSSGGNGISYSLSTNQGTVNQNLTLYAVWTAITYSNWAYSLSKSDITSSIAGKTSYYYYNYNYVFSVKVTNGNGHIYTFKIENTSSSLFSVTLKTTNKHYVSTNSTTLSCTVNIKSNGNIGTGAVKFSVSLYDEITGSSVYSSSQSFSQNLEAGYSVTEE